MSTLDYEVGETVGLKVSSQLCQLCLHLKPDLEKPLKLEITNIENGVIYAKPTFSEYVFQLHVLEIFKIEKG